MKFQNLLPILTKRSMVNVQIPSPFTIYIYIYIGIEHRTMFSARKN